MQQALDAPLTTCTCKPAAFAPSQILPVRHARHRHCTSATRQLGTSRWRCQVPSTSPSSSPNNLLIIGAGDLGLLVGHQWRQIYPSCTILGETRSTQYHDRLERAGIQPVLRRGDVSKYTDGVQFDNVIFCIPPPKQPGYYDTLTSSLSTSTSTSTSTSAKFLFVSSTAVCPRHAPTLTERTDCSDVSTERGLLLRSCEDAVLGSGRGVVVRFSGLYSLYRGGHAFWVERGMCRVSERGSANMLHRYDAARLVVKALRHGKVGEVYLGCSKDAVNARQMCEAMALHPAYEGRQRPTEFAHSFDEGRACDGEWTREQLQWKPRWESFVEFMREDGQRVGQGKPLDRLIE